MGLHQFAQDHVTITDAVPFIGPACKTFTKLYCFVSDALVGLYAARGPAQLFWAGAFPQLRVHTVRKLTTSMSQAEA